MMIEKIIGKFKYWILRLLFYVGRIILINLVFFFMLMYWVSIFILFKLVIEKVNIICRDFLWFEI